MWRAGPKICRYKTVNRRQEGMEKSRRKAIPVGRLKKLRRRFTKYTCR